jgi:signal transduction histidine kinase/ActR/RegA family two-component response regulator
VRPDAQSRIDRLPCGWLKMERRGTVMAVNATLCRMLGMDASQLVGAHLDSLLTPASRVLYQSYLQPLLLLHGHVEEFSLAFRDAEGRTVEALIYSAGAFSAHSDADGHSIQASDANHLELVVASLRKRSDIEQEMLRIKRAADHAPGMIFQFMQLRGGSCHFPYTSEAIRRMYGVSSQQARDSVERLLGLLDEKTRASLASGLRQAAAAAQDWRAIFEVQLPGQPARWHEAQATPSHLANGDILWHGHSADVTDRLAMEVAVADKATIDRMHDARSEFLARVSHELRTPLNGILGFTQLLANDKADNLSAEQRARLDVVMSSGRHLLTLVNEVLEVTSIQAAPLQFVMQPLELRPLLTQALHSVQGVAQAMRVHLLAADCPPGLRVQSHPQRLHQVLVNLLTNAVKYNRSGGTVRISASAQPQGVQVTVSDTGVGMTELQRAALFQPFNRLGAENTPVAGNGLGLVITKELLGRLDATLSVDSQAGLGSSFTVMLPAAQASLPAVAALPKRGSAPSSKLEAAAALVQPQAHGTVLYVEDDEVNAALMSAILGMRPQVQLVLAVDCASALRSVQQAVPDLLLLDMHLPDGNGMDLLTALRRLPGMQTVPAVMVSAGAREDDVQQASSSGFIGYWTKPLDVKKTLRELDAILTVAAGVVE